MVWYFHLFQNFPQLIVIHTVKGFGIVNKAEIDVFLELSCFVDDPADVGNLIENEYYILKYFIPRKAKEKENKHFVKDCWYGVQIIFLHFILWRM